MRKALRTKFLGVILLVAMTNIYPQELNFNDHTFYLPHPYRVGQTVSSLGLSTAKLPEDVVETDDIFRGPLFSYKLNYGLPKNFLVSGGIETNIVTFNFTVGPKWNYELDRLGFSVGTDIAFFTGKLHHFGFDTKFYGWMMYPNLTVGYKFNKFSISVKSELVFNLAETSKNGDLEISNDLDFFNGWTIGIYLEQPLWKDNFVVLGIRSTFLKFYYPMWAAFSTFDRSFYIPEATVMFIL